VWRLGGRRGIPEAGCRPGVGERVSHHAAAAAGDIRREALAATPPASRERAASRIWLSLRRLTQYQAGHRYAGKDNFLSTPLYSAARAFMQRPAARSAGSRTPQAALQGYGLLIHDAYRPWSSVTKMFWEATPDDKRIFVANPAEGSRHNRGCAVDLTYTIGEAKACGDGGCMTRCPSVLIRIIPAARRCSAASCGAEACDGS